MLLDNSLAGVTLEKTDCHIYCRIDQPREVFSSAILNGGKTVASQFLNLKVGKAATADLAPPHQALLQYCQKQGWPSDCVGMMTAASMNSLRFEVVKVEAAELLVLVTTGLGNARRAGDILDCEDLAKANQSAYKTCSQAGTINIAIISNSRFSEAAMVELMMMATEAKCAALQDANIVSPVSGRIATGTGTDAIAVFNGLPSASDELVYCGKHTQLGQVFAQTLMALISDSISWQD